jgi:RNA polymerase sigma factor (sigma-70 family)
VPPNRRSWSPDEDFEVWFDEMRAPAVRVARRIACDRADEYDLAAEAFARALARWDKVAHLPYRDAWLLRTVANLALDAIRRKRPRLEPPRPAEPVDAVALRLTLAHALEALPRRQREAIVLRYLADLSEDEVAAALSVSPGTVKTHVKRGLASLRVHLSTPFEELLANVD